MRLTLIDSRALAVSVCNPATGQWYNWATSLFETPFNATNHLRNMAPVEVEPSAVDVLVTADLEQSILAFSDAVALVWTTAPLAILDPRTLTYPIPRPGTYGWPS